MKKLLLIAIILAGFSIASGQTNGVAYRLRGGLAAARPTTCKATAPADQYYATDTDIEYICSSANTWSILAVASSGGPGTVTTTGSPSSGQVAILSGATSITGDADFTFSVDTLTFTKGIVPTGLTVRGLFNSCLDAGANDSYACSMTPTLSAYAIGQVVWFKANTANTGAATLAVNGLSAIPIKKLSGAITTVLDDNDIRAGQWVQLMYDGTNFQMLSQIGNAAGIANSAGNNVVTKSNGTNLVASQITDDGTAVKIATALGKEVDIGGFDPSGYLSVSSVTIIGDVQSTSNGTTITVDDAAQTVNLDPNATLNIGNAVSINNVGGISGVGSISPIAAGGSAIGLAASPFSSIFLGNATNHSIQITCSTCTANRAPDFPDASGTVQLVGAANTGAILGIPINNTVLATATGTVYSSPGNDGTALSIATEGNVSFPVTRAGTIRNLYVRTGGTAKTNTPTTVITIRKNGVDTAVTLTMTQTVNTTTSDTSHSFTVVAGDLITVSFTTTGAAGISTSIAGVSFEID